MFENHADIELWVNETFDKVNKKLLLTAPRTMGKLPYTANDGVYDNKAVNNVSWWTNGFWGGMMWLMYSYTKEDVYKEAALDSEKLIDKALENYRSLHHDVGFMWHLLSGANFKLTGDKAAENKNLFMAAMLSSRYNIHGKYIKAWDFEGTHGYTIIDTMMNLPLLYWASERLGDERFKAVAMSHADMALCNHIRPDGSVRHIVEHDITNGDVIMYHAGQGYSSESCWTRGSAWAIYGMMLSYIHTGEKRYYTAAAKTAKYFIEHAKQSDYKVVVDFLAPKEPVYYDTTAAACACCGILELAKHTQGEESTYYYDAAVKILKALDENFCDYDVNRDSIVQMGTERYPSESMKGVHIPIIYGDFFYVEALLKLKNHDFLIW